MKRREDHFRRVAGNDAQAAEEFITLKQLQQNGTSPNGTSPKRFPLSVLGGIGQWDVLVDDYSEYVRQGNVVFVNLYLTFTVPSGFDNTIADVVGLPYAGVTYSGLVVIREHSTDVRQSVQVQPGNGPWIRGAFNFGSTSTGELGSLNAGLHTMQGQFFYFTDGTGINGVYRAYVDSLDSYIAQATSDNIYRGENG